MDTQALILFDGVCNLCNRFVQFVIRHDRKKQFRFAALQSAAGKALLAQHEPVPLLPDSVVLLYKGKVYRQSAAALRVFKGLDGLWPLLYIFILIPPFIRDAVYRLIARKRYRIF
ncbi:MAG: DUF393 domain-containing protein, partial [Chitinophagaceae bacterium]|nr:DUF393 domain-containing protein [Chitinophagaceae bacterium]